jgi:signal transduction histidine kinase
VDLSALVAEVSGLVVPAIEDKRLELRIELSEELPTLRTDASKVRQILLNLLGNAVKFTKEGHVRIRAEPQNAHVILVVEDTGIGIAPENQVQIFERFWQVSQGETRIQGGTGLGLAVVRDLARLLGGDVAVESALGRGTTFTVLLPLVAPLRR